MIRAARHTDTKALEGLIRRQHAASKYAGRCGVCDKALQALLLALIAGQTQTSVGATHVTVAMRDGKVTGFIAGSLQRVYQIGDRLEANDHFFVNEGGLGDTMALVDSYLAWAGGNPKVLDIRLSWTDVVPGAEKIVGLLERKGLRKTGEVWSLNTDSAREVAA